MITGLNHITLAVSELDRSISFYCDVLGCTLAHRWSQGAYLQAGQLWLCLMFSNQVDAHHDYTHIAFSASTSDLAYLCDKLSSLNIRRWQENQSEGESLYILDPDGHKLEIHNGTLASRLEHIRTAMVQDNECGVGL